jgi:hypothetical protein
MYTPNSGFYIENSLLDGKWRVFYLEKVLHIAYTFGSAQKWLKQYCEQHGAIYPYFV